MAAQVSPELLKYSYSRQGVPIVVQGFLQLPKN